MWWRRAMVRPPAEQIKAVGEAKKSLTDTGVRDLQAQVDDLAESVNPLADDAERASEARASLRDVPLDSAGVAKMRDQMTPLAEESDRVRVALDDMTIAAQEDAGLTRLTEQLTAATERADTMRATAWRWKTPECPSDDGGGRLTALQSAVADLLAQAGKSVGLTDTKIQTARLDAEVQSVFDRLATLRETGGESVELAISSTRPIGWHTNRRGRRIAPCFAEQPVLADPALTALADQLTRLLEQIHTAQNDRMDLHLSGGVTGDGINSLLGGDYIATRESAQADLLNNLIARGLTSSQARRVSVARQNGHLTDNVNVQGFSKSEKEMARSVASEIVKNLKWHGNLAF